MRKNKKNEELQSRREFFKRAAKGTLPIIGVMAFGPGFLSSCGGDDAETGAGSSAPPTSGGDGSFMNPYSPSEAIKKAQTLSEGQTTDIVVIKGRVSSILYNYNVEEGTATFFIKDIGKDSEELQVYRAYYLGNSPYTYGRLLSVNDEVIIQGKLSIYNGKPEVANRSGYLYSMNGVTNPSNSCTDCSAVCTSNCSTECTSSCTGGCSTSCTGECGNSCTGGCSTTCTGTCSGSCNTTCTGACSTTCTGNCTGTATGQCNTCSKSCMQYCGYGCKNSCSGNCDTTCDNSCGGLCESNCTHVGYGSNSCSICSGTCSRTCGTACAINCSGSCTSTCKGTSS